MQSDFLVAKEVAAVLRCSLSKAYKVMQTINRERADKGLITIRGRIPRKALMERVGI